MTGCMYGPEILLWLPEQSIFATMFWSNPTMRNEYANLHPMQGSWVTFEVRLIDDGKNSWHGPKVASCQTPPTNVPDDETFRLELNKFNNPPETEVEKVDDSGDTNERPQ